MLRLHAAESFWEWFCEFRDVPHQGGVLEMDSGSILLCHMSAALDSHTFTLILLIHVVLGSVTSFGCMSLIS